MVLAGTGSAGAGEFDDYRAYIAAAEGALRAGDTRDAVDWLEATARRHRNWEWGYLRVATDVSERTFDAGGIPVTSVACDATGALVAAGTEKGRIGVWDTASKKLLASLAAHPGAVTAMAFGPGAPGAVARTLATSAGDDSVKHWELDQAGGTLRQVADSAAGAAGLLVTSGSTAGRWEELGLPGKEKDFLAIATAPDGRLQATGSPEQVVRLWSTDPTVPRDVLLGHRGPVRAVAFCGAGGQFVSGSSDGTVKMWSTDRTRARTILRHPAPISSVSWSPDGKRLATAGADGHMRLWDVASRQVLTDIVAATEPVAAVAFLADGKHVVAGGSTSPPQIWDAATGARLQALVGHDGGITDLAVDRQGRWIATAGADGSARVWDAGDGHALRTLTVDGAAGPAAAVALARDAALLAAGWQDGPIGLWRLPAGEPVSVLQTTAGGIVAMALDPDGRLLAVGTDLGELTVWDAGSGKVLHQSLVHDNAIHGLEFSPDATRLATASADFTLRLWDTGRWTPALTLRSFDNELSCAGYHPVGHSLALCVGDQTVTILGPVPGRDLLQRMVTTGP
jgi:WD40 repeat protein